MFVDSAGNIYPMGASIGTNSDLNQLLLKYDSDGNLLWEQRYDGTGNGFDLPLTTIS